MSIWGALYFASPVISTPESERFRILVVCAEIPEGNWGPCHARSTDDMTVCTVFGCPRILPPPRGKSRKLKDIVESQGELAHIICSSSLFSTAPSLEDRRTQREKENLRASGSSGRGWKCDSTQRGVVIIITHDCRTSIDFKRC